MDDRKTERSMDRNFTHIKFRGNWDCKGCLLYTAPKDNTPGCTRQACAFAESYKEFEEMGAVVIGISKDSEASHNKFAEKYNLPFILLSDHELTAIKAYEAVSYTHLDVYKRQLQYYMICIQRKRTSFIP